MRDLRMCRAPTQNLQIYNVLDAEVLVLMVSTHCLQSRSCSEPVVGKVCNSGYIAKRRVVKLLAGKIHLNDQMRSG